ncbi:MAG: hypothetical protein ACRDGG_07560, partial [Anaerolineae bacterium]
TNPSPDEPIAGPTHPRANPSPDEPIPGQPIPGRRADIKCPRYNTAPDESGYSGQPRSRGAAP